MEHKNLPGTPFPQVPNELFKRQGYDSVYIQDKVDTRLRKIIDETKGDKGHEITDEGYLTYHLSFPYPEKGVRDNYMMQSVQFVKRFLMNWVRFLTTKQLLPAYLVLFLIPWKWKIKILESFLKNFCDYANMVDAFGKNFILEPKYYTREGQELIKFISNFLREMGISQVLADDTGLIFVALVDNDTAYYYKRGD